MGNSLFTVYKSSAGSGKTFTLTLEYLKLALAKSFAYRSILAVTFTNKATQEMKERIIQSLADFANGHENPMASLLMEYLSLDAQKFQDRSKHLLTAILHDYSRFSVQTIDTFFQGVLRTFSRELGLHGNAELLLDYSESLEQVTDQLLEELSDNRDLRDWLGDFANEKIESGKNWDFRKEIIDFSKELFKEEFLQIESKVFSGIEGHVFFKEYRQSLFKIINGFRNSMKAIGDEGLKLMEDQGVSVDDFSYKKGGAAGYFIHLSEGTKYEPGTRVLKAVENDGEGMISKSSKIKEKLEFVVNNGLLKILQQAVLLYEKDYKRYTTAEAIVKNIYLLGILSDIYRKVGEYKSEEGVMFISDAAVFLQNIIGDNESPFIYERIGSYYNHFLIDEFQDTSAMQWNNFKPLVENSLSEGNKNLVVGDVKQSIYRWRGGDWRLLLHKLKEDISETFYAEQNLPDNYRSKPNVVTFNNELFPQLVALAVQHLPVDSNLAEENPEFAEMLLSIPKAYEEVKQNIPFKHTHQGHIDISFLEDEEELGWKEKALERLPVQLEHLQDRGVKLSDIAILVRKASHGKEIADYLMHFAHSSEAKSDYRYTVVSNESLYLNAAPVVRLIIDVMKLLNNEEDMVSLAHVVYMYQFHVQQNEQLNRDDLFVHIEEKVELLPEAFWTEKEALKRLDIYELSEAIIRIFSLHFLKSDIPYLQTFQDVVLEYGNKGGIRDFLDWWEQNHFKYAIQVPEALDAAKILTIHKSKGLQFKAVLVPFLEWDLGHGNNNPLLWLKPSESPFDKVHYLPMKHSKSSMVNTLFEEEYWIEQTRAYLDNINLLYVAFTRAEDALLCMASSKIGKTLKIDGLLQLALQQEEQWQEEEKSLRIGSMEDISPSKKEAQTDLQVSLDNYPAFEWDTKLRIKQEGKELLQEDEREKRLKIDMGVLVHEVFARLLSFDQLDAVMESLRIEGFAEEADLKEARAIVFNSITASEQMNSWFKTDWQVRTEIAVLDPKGGKSRLDRVLLKEKRAKIIDFKTGLPKKRDQHQVTAYKNTLLEMGYAEVEAYVAYLNPLNIVTV